MRDTASDQTINSGIWRALGWIGVALQVAALVFVIWSERWGGAWTIALFAAVSAAFLAMQDRLPTLLAFLVVLTSLLNAGGWAWNWYNEVIWFDEFIHTFTSFTVMSALGYIAWARKWTDAAPGTGRFILWTAGVGLGLGIAWEICESIFLDLRFWDTILDLILDTAGAAAAGWFLGRILGHRPRPAVS